MKKYVSVLWQKPIHPQKTQKNKVGAAMAVWLIKLYACGARARGSIPGLATWFFRDCLSPLPSCNMAEIPLKRRKSSIQPTNQKGKVNVKSLQSYWWGLEPRIRCSTGKGPNYCKAAALIKGYEKQVPALVLQRKSKPDKSEVHKFWSFLFERPGSW